MGLERGRGRGSGVEGGRPTALEEEFPGSAGESCRRLSRPGYGCRKRHTFGGLTLSMPATCLSLLKVGILYHAVSSEGGVGIGTGLVPEEQQGQHIALA